MALTDQTKSGLRPTLNVWQAVGISVALMAPSMAANINPQGTASLVGRATPLAFFLAALAVLFIAYGFVRLCQYYRHAGSVYAFVGATLGPHAGAVAGLGLIATYTFYGLVTSSAAGIFGASFLDDIGVWNNQPWWAGFAVGAVALALALAFTIVPARRATSILLSAEGITVLLIIAIAAVVLVRILAGNAPGDATFTLDVLRVAPGTGNSALFLGIVFGLLSFAGFEAAATLGEEAHNPRRDIPRAILGTAIFGGLYFTVVTAIEMMGFGTDAAGVTAFQNSPALMGDLGTSFVGSWVGDLITLGAAVSAYACCLACVVGASRMVFAVARDLSPGAALARTGRNGTPVNAAIGVTGAIVAIALVSATAGAAKPFDTFFWSGTIGTLILLVAYVLATLGSIKLVFVDRLLPVPRWQIVIPVAALVMLGYTIYRNIWPWPTEGAMRWFPIIAFGWLLLVTLVVILAPEVPRRMARGMASFEGLSEREPV
jgi:amino acid transporter